MTDAKLSDARIDQLIAQAVAYDGGDGIPALIELRDQLQLERGPADPAVARAWDALVRVSCREPDDLEDYLFHAEGRARWRSDARGPSHPDTIAAWSELADAAEDEGAWDLAIRAWHEVIAAPITEADRLTLVAISHALRGLGARKLLGGQHAEAHALFERDLAINDQLFPDADPQLVISVANLALAVERQGDHPRAHQLRLRQRALLVATGASPNLISTLDAQIARLA